eukprot:12316720-Alexandrium_andersonii.AAC.1
MEKGIQRQSHVPSPMLEGTPPAIMGKCPPLRGPGKGTIVITISGCPCGTRARSDKSECLL